MKLPLPPSGGQGGHYGFSSTKRARTIDTGTRSDGPERVPRRFRGLKLRRRRRSRLTREHPLMSVLVLAVIAVPLAGIVYALWELLGLLLGS